MPRDADTSADAGADVADSYPRLQADQIGEPERIATGFGLAESPLWDRCNERLLFTDVVGGDGQSGVIHSVDARGEVDVVASDTSNANGIAYGIDGALILAQMGGSPGHIGRLDPSGQIEALEPLDAPTLHTPDDVVVRSDGTIYVSDGDFYPIGNLLGFDDELPVYMLQPGADELVPVTTVSGPNGVELSPDEQTLYVNAYGAGTVVSFGVAEDGTLSGQTVLLEGLTSPDSLCLDAAGNLYVAVNEGLLLSDPDGESIGVIEVPMASALNGTTNCTFGGDDGRTLFITAWDSLYEIDDMPIPGLDWIVGQRRQDCD